jgi:putative addiction module component (TIGR02574 family)
MSRPLADLIAEVLARPEGDREELFEAVCGSLPPPDGVLSADDPGYEAEIKRRVDEVRNGTADLIPWEQVRQELMADDSDAAD